MDFEHHHQRGKKVKRVTKLQGYRGRFLHEVEFFFDFLESFQRKTGFAIGEELFADIDAFGPGPELLFLLLGGIGLLEGEPSTVDFEPFSEKVGTAQACDIGADFPEANPAGGLIDRARAARAYWRESQRAMRPVEGLDEVCGLGTD